MPYIKALALLFISLYLCACNSSSDSAPHEQKITTQDRDTQDRDTQDNSEDDSNISTDTNPDEQNGSHPPTSDLDAALRLRVKELGMNGDPLDGRTLPDINDSLIAQLGRELFFDTQLSGDNDVACVSCHHPELGGADALSLPIGVGAIDPTIIGPGRRHNGNYLVDPEADGGPNVERNSPTTFNMALYDHALFSDGRVQSVELFNNRYRESVNPSPNGSGDLIRTPDSFFDSADPQSGFNLTHAQAKFPLVSLAEMQGFKNTVGNNNDEVRDNLVQRYTNDNNWVTAFRNAYGDMSSEDKDVVTLSRLTFALGEYQRSQIFVTSPWSQYLKQQNEISDDAKVGALLFLTSVNDNGAGCFECHSGDFFTDEKFYNLAIPQIGRGKASQGRDLGRYSVSRNPQDIFAHRTPSLLNVSTTAPYGHSGAFNNLTDIIKHHNAPLNSINNFDYSLQALPQFNGLGISYEYAQSNTREAYTKYTETMILPENEKINPNPSLTDLQISQLVAFIETLTDPCILDKQCLSPWIASNTHLEKNRLEVILNPGFSNIASIPVPSATSTPPGYGLPDLGQVPLFNPVCASSPNEELFPDFSFSKSIFNNGIEINRNFSSQAIANTTKSLFMLINTGSMATGDINGDCKVDLIFTQGDLFPLKVYLNNGNGYSQANDNWGLSNVYSSAGITLADLNGDGWLDLFTGDLLGTKPRVFLNNGRDSFQQITHPGFKVNRATVGAGFGDIDNDGDLDAFLAHWDTNLAPEEEHLWLNNGAGLFTPGARKYGLTGEFGDRDWVFTPNFADVNKDGKQDLLITADFSDSQYFIQGDTGMENQTSKGLIRDENGMGAAIADFDNDQDLDWFVSSIYDARIISGEIDINSTTVSWPYSGNRLYSNEINESGDMVFKDVIPFSLTELQSLTDQTILANGDWGWGACAADFNNDGWTDIYHVNGYGFDPLEFRTDLHYLFPLIGFVGLSAFDAFSTFAQLLSFIVIELSEQQKSDLQQLYNASRLLGFMGNSGEAYLSDEARLFINQKDGTFKEMAAATFVNDNGQGRGVSCFDYDRDGDIDIVITNNTGNISFYENKVSSTLSNTANYIDIKLLGLYPNIQAIGAKITIETIEGVQYKELRVENNYISQNPIESHFGVGSNDSIIKISILWPNGDKQELLNQGVNTMLVIKQ